ncbi:DegT/DnrJ/EryC1/StrS aminotransferase family protein [Polynucleobacter paneuropaeus]|uniref:DegT/DnrJ/EryC1/StrS family aminotransferase n=1 Tax=Polynucleobacter paneuropaeus TaxID=2527775 RepID=A0A2Z4JQZ4_9BURK|nr:DegT/DnrJ/EryC1/StrS family aminotransferase [Polynucleobacter paneuropaeus]AWW49187.1 DegT/DnrJ/EryC1/StrS family aminotransferase [Polynucleobacter paneuropaeus]
MKDKPIYVTEPFLPPLDEFTIYLKQIWKNKTLTNGGLFHQQLEKALCEYLGVEHISLFNNGTVGLITALQALKIKGEVITTPYSFVATAHSLLWNGIEPVFVDIDPSTLNLDPSKIEAAITSKTTAIMPVHCYGHPCDVEAIQEIADRHNLKVIYDAAHAFGVQCDCGSVLKHGDLSVLSFHATKVFNTFEGGAIVCPNAETKRLIDRLKNFGFVDEVTVNVAGINGKMSEVNAAFGLVQLNHIDAALEGRKTADTLYRALLKDVMGIRFLEGSGERVANYSYFPIMVESSYPLTRDELYHRLKQSNIFARRYFYPLISEFPVYKKFPSASPGMLPVATKASQEVLCLPLYSSLPEVEQLRIVSLIKNI